MGFKDQVVTFIKKKRKKRNELWLSFFNTKFPTTYCHGAKVSLECDRDKLSKTFILCQMLNSEEQKAQQSTRSIQTAETRRPFLRWEATAAFWQLLSRRQLWELI